MTAGAGEPGTSAPAFTMLGEPDAVVCEGDVCAVPALDGVEIEPTPEEAAAASARAVTAALDEGASL